MIWQLGGAQLTIVLLFILLLLWSFAGGSDGKESACSEEDLGLIPATGRLVILVNFLSAVRSYLSCHLIGA